MADLFDTEQLTSVPMTPEQRTELMTLAKTLRAAADQIDKITQRKKAKDLDENGEPTFRFGAKVVIPDDFMITRRMVKYAIEHGFTEKQIKDVADTFVNWYRKSGKKWQDWSRVWMDWVRVEEKKILDGKVRVTTDRMKKW